MLCGQSAGWPGGRRAAGIGQRAAVRIFDVFKIDGKRDSMPILIFEAGARIWGCLVDIPDNGVGDNFPGPLGARMILVCLIFWILSNMEHVFV